MADKEKSQQSSQGPGDQNEAFQAALLDVIVRGLDLAKRKPKGAGEVEVRDFCALAYGTPGHFCFIGYYHPT
jgi:hypothetical protein